MANVHTPVVIMVSGGSDSAALAYMCANLCESGNIGHLAAVHVNHCIRGEEADADQAFVEDLCELLGIPLHTERVNIPEIVEATGDNIEAVARRERYRVATSVLHALCTRTCEPNASGRIFTAHTQDDRVENFYMRSIVGTGPGGFRSMRYLNGNVARPCLDVSKQDLRDYLLECERAGELMARKNGVLWCEDATNAHTDMFRAFVRHEIVPVARQRNTSLLTTLSRTMNLIADEDDYMDGVAQDAASECCEWVGERDDEVASHGGECDSCDSAHDAQSVLRKKGCDAQSDSRGDGQDAHDAQSRVRSCRLLPAFGEVDLSIARRVVLKVLQEILGTNIRVESASVNAVLDAFENVDVGAGSGVQADVDLCAQTDVLSDAQGAKIHTKRKPKSGYSTNIQGDLAVSANKRGVLIEPMSEYRKRRGRI